MDIDPLADTVPPRHAVESDEEEDEYNPLSSSVRSKQKAGDAEVKILGDTNSFEGRTLVIANGGAGKVWARGANLGEQSGAIMVNGIQVGLLFNPSWTKSNVLVSEVTTRLPVWAMYNYADVVLASLKPFSVALLDTYATPAYITANPVPFHEAPMRYLCTKGSLTLSPNVQPFSPPNLIQSTSASFLSLISTLSSLSSNLEASCTGRLILLPTPHILPPPPGSIAPTRIASLDDGSEAVWETCVIREAQKVLFGAAGEVAGEWKGGKDAGMEEKPKVGRRGDLGEGGMYI